MTYADFLGLFLILPLAVVAMRARRRVSAAGCASLALLLVFVYAGTIPWDSTAVAHGLWSFEPTRTWQFRPFGLPFEELLFFGLQSVLTGLWVLWRLERRFVARA